MRTAFLRLALFAVGFTVAPPTATQLHAQLVNDTVNLSVVGAGVGQPGNFNINVGGSAVVASGSEFIYGYPQIELQVDVGASGFQLQFTRTGPFGDLSGPVAWTLSDQNLKNASTQIVGITPIPPSFAAPLAVQSYQVINGYTVEVTTGQSTDLTGGSDQNANFQLQFAPVPEPGTLALTGWAAIGWVTFWRRRWRSNVPPATLSA